MNEARLKEVYAATMARPRSEHPVPEAIQALARREGNETDRLATLDHVMSCAACRAELDLLRSIERAGTETGAVRRGGHRSWLIPAALAATVLLGVGLGRSALTGGGDEPLRGDEDAAVAVTAPAAEAPAGEPLTFAWRAVPNASRYRVEVLAAGGDLAIEAETRDTAVTIEGIRRLDAGDYRWWVVAMTPGPGPRSALRPLRLINR